MRKFAIVTASAMLGIAMAFSVAIPAYAASKVDCDAVMQSLNSGKHAKDVATEMSISTSSVYRCKRHAKAAAKAETKAQGKGRGAQGAVQNNATGGGSMGAPAAAASPAN
ncbi:MAG: hypothetical protein WA740_08735 [Candidatus Binataceae bacterium]